MKISRKPTPPRPTAPSRPSRLVTADMALARAKISGMGLGEPNWLPELPEGGSSVARNPGTGSGGITTATPVSSAGCATPANANTHLRPRGSSSLTLSTRRLAAGHSQSNRVLALLEAPQSATAVINQRLPASAARGPGLTTLQSGGISIFRLAEGRIAEHWEQLDRLALMQQTKTPRSRRVVPLSPTAERLLRDVRANQRVERLNSRMWCAPASAVGGEGRGASELAKLNLPRVDVGRPELVERPRADPPPMHTPTCG
jgi:hypothetical protein